MQALTVICHHIFNVFFFLLFQNSPSTLDCVAVIVASNESLTEQIAYFRYDAQNCEIVNIGILLLCLFSPAMCVLFFLARSAMRLGWQNAGCS